MKRRTILGASVVGLLAATSPLDRADAQASPPTDRERALRALAVRLDLPLVDEATAVFGAQLRRTIPSAVVETAGRNAGLGPRWARGDALFDEATRRLDAALAADEARNGPLVALGREDLLDAVNLPWTVDDIAFIVDTLPTPLGREAERAIDAKGAQQIVATVTRRVPVAGDGRATRERLADIASRADAKFGDALLMLLPLRGTDPARAGRLQRLVEVVTVAPSDALGQKLVDRITRRLVDAAFAQVPLLLDRIR